jgi:ankyrin repeat protein
MTVVRLLLENGADINAQDGKHGNALQAASTGGHEKVVRLLLASRKEIEQTTKGQEILRLPECLDTVSMTALREAVERPQSYAAVHWPIQH